MTVLNQTGESQVEETQVEETEAGQRLLIVQHHPLEAAGHCLAWAQSRGWKVSVAQAWQAEFPEPQNFDAVILLGGPVSVRDRTELTWLALELVWLARVLAQGTHVFGICLGAQLLAHQLGAPVLAMAKPELGWVVCNATDEFSELLPAPCFVLQWHEECFELPPGAKAIASSELCHNQGFVLTRDSQKLMGVQFHPEWDAAMLAALIESLAQSEPSTKPVLRSALAQPDKFAQQVRLATRLLDYWMSL